MALTFHQSQLPITGVLPSPKFPGPASNDSTSNNSSTLSNRTSTTLTPVSDPTNNNIHTSASMASINTIFTEEQLRLQMEGKRIYARPVFPIQSPFCPSSTHGPSIGTATNSPKKKDSDCRHSQWLAKSCHKAVGSTCHLSKCIKEFCHHHNHCEQADTNATNTAIQSGKEDCEECTLNEKMAKRKNEWERYKAIQFMGIDSPNARNYSHHLGY